MSIAGVVRSIPRNVLLSGLLLLIAGGMLAVAVIQRVDATHDGSGALHACVSRYTGAMRYVIDPARCTAGEFPITLSAGNAVPSTPTYIVRTLETEIDGDSFSSATVECEAGETAIGGGSLLRLPQGAETNFGGFTVRASAPVGSPPTAWWSGYDLVGSGFLENDEFIESWVLCVS